jgi:hypothetical protein
LNYVLEHNKGILFDEGAKFRQAAAIATDQILENESRTPTRTTEVQVLEESDTPTWGDGLRVVR